MVKSRKVSKRVHQRHKKTKKASKMRGSGVPNSLHLTNGKDLEISSSHNESNPVLHLPNRNNSGNSSSTKKSNTTVFGLKPRTPQGRRRAQTHTNV
jgi:hypothetical protein